MWPWRRDSARSQSRLRGLFGWAVALLLGSSFLAIPFLLSISQQGDYGTGAIDNDLLDLSERLVALNGSANRSLQAQAAVDLGRSAKGLSLEKQLEPYIEDEPGSNATADGGAVQADTYSAAMALLALAAQSNNGTNRSVVQAAQVYEDALVSTQGQGQGQGQGSGQTDSIAPFALGLRPNDSHTLDSFAWDGDVLDTAVASFAIQVSAKVTNSNTTEAVSNANRWLAFNAVDSEAPPIEQAFYSLALADDSPNATARLEALSAMQAENGSIGDAENTSWAAVALTTGDRPELLESAGKAVEWLSSQKDLDDADTALSAYAQTAYERRYIEMRDSAGNGLPRPASMDGAARPGAKAPALEAPYWLGPLGTILLTIGAVGLFARLRTEDRILTKGRHRILEYIRNEPGQDQAGIQRDLELSTGSAVYNLGVLADKGYLTVHRDGRHKRYYVNGNALRPVANGMTKYIVSALRNVNTKRMAMYIMERPGAPQKEVSESLALDPSTVHWHAERLKKVGVLSSMREGRNVAYRIERPEIILQILSFIP